MYIHEPIEKSRFPIDIKCRDLRVRYLVNRYLFRIGMTYFLQFKDNGDVFCRNRGVPEYAGMPILKKFFGWLPVSNDG